MLKKLIKFIPFVVWMSIIFYFSSRSTTGIGTNQTDRFLILKSFHLIEYAILVFLFLFAVYKRKLAIFIAYLYAVSDEIHQYFIPGRTGRLRDTLIDLIGILIGVFIFDKIFSLKKKRFPLY
jgi:VanZ family protein